MRYGKMVGRLSTRSPVKSANGKNLTASQRS